MNGYIVNDINYFRVMQLNYQTNEGAKKTDVQIKGPQKSQSAGTDFSRMLATEIKKFT